MRDSVARTALDALNAKVSMVHVGFKPTPIFCDEYEVLLREMKAKISPSTSERVRRQTPLVNCGYAARVTVITHILFEIMRSLHAEEKLAKSKEPDLSQTESNDYDSWMHCNILILGGGFDVLGCWLILVAQKYHINLSIYELDLFENTSNKRKALNEGIGPIRVLEKNNVFLSQNRTLHTYNFGSVDLTGNEEYLRQELLGLGLDSKLPTIALSELVLSYLGRTCAYNLIDFISCNILKASKSMLVLYESIGEVKQKRIENFRESYTKQFISKLNRGTSKLGNSCSSKGDCFAPLGKNEASIRDSLTNIFGSVYSLPIATALSNCVPSLKSPELFDEYAALRLHLSCYVCISAFSHNTPKQFADNISACWTGNQVFNNVMNEYAYVPIETGHQEAVRKLFETIYSQKVIENKSIRKMVKTALNSDLSAEHLECEWADLSSIRKTYRDRGGDFWISLSKLPGNGIINVVGFIGVVLRSMTEHERVRRKYSEICKIYEIQRLVVDELHRKKSIASTLLANVVEWVKENNTSPEEKILLVAVTLAQLKEANYFYVKNGFEVEQKDEVGGLVYVTYSKQLYPI